MSGKHLLVGDPVDDMDNLNQSGLVYAYRWNGTEFSQTQLLLADFPVSLGRFGSSIDIDGDRAAISSSGFGGGIHLFRRVNELWIPETVLESNDSVSFSLSSVAISGDRVLAGDPATRPDGAASLFELDGDEWNETRIIISDRVGLGTGVDFYENEAIVGTDAGANSVFIIDPFAQAAVTRVYGEGWPGKLRIPELSLTSPPIVGSTFFVSIQNSSDVESLGVLMLGLEVADLPTLLDGQLLVQAKSYFPVSIPSTQLRLRVQVPDRLDLIGVSLYLQSLQLDSDASQGVAFTPGLEVILGECEALNER